MRRSPRPGRSRQRLAGPTDVSTLTAWLDRNAAYDAAVRDLYQSLRRCQGPRHGQGAGGVRRRDRRPAPGSPADTRGLTVIMGEVAQGGLNQAVISIEEVRGSLAAAIETQAKLKAPPALPE